MDNDVQWILLCEQTGERQTPLLAITICKKKVDEVKAFHYYYWMVQIVFLVALS